MGQKTILITGGSRGIGAETVKLFARRGYAVALNYNHSEKEALALTDLLRSEGCTVLPIKADVSREEEVAKMVDIVLENFCHLDTLLCNAGVEAKGLFTDMDYFSWRNHMAVNVDGVFHCCQKVIPHMVSRKQGQIITMSSVWGMVGASCEVAYSTGKAAIIGMTKALAKELGPSNITVNCVAPGVIDTEMNNNISPEIKEILAEETPLGRMGTALEVAEAVYFLASQAASFFTGQILSPNGGFVI